MDTLFKPYSQSEFREDVQGIRAVGAVLILVYHIWFQKVSGGVDVFFVVSGYLMGGLLLRNYAKNGAIEPFRFWGRIITRVAPSAYVVLLASLGLGYLYIAPAFWKNSIDEFIFSAVHLENVRLMAEGADYLDREVPPSLFQQFWALSIQIQFYAMLPLVIGPALIISRRFRSLAPIVIITVTFIALSFIYSNILTTSRPDIAYFHTGARFWEFLVGVLVALLSPFVNLRAGLRSWLGFVGLAGLFLVGVLVPVHVHFPGWVALVPVLAATALILSGGGIDKQKGVTRFLSNKSLAQIGGVSFSIYLWHWPILVIFQHQYAPELSLFQGFSVISISIILALITKNIVEDPFRRLPASRTILAYSVGVLFFLPTFAVGMGAREYFKGQDESWAASVGQLRQVQWDGNVIELQNDASSIPISFYALVHDDITESVKGDCNRGMSSPEIVLCEFGDLESEEVIALVGGSHVAQWEPVFSDLGKEHGFKVVTIIKNGCSLGYNIIPDNVSCISWNENIVPFIIQFSPSLVITNSTRTNRFGVLDEVEFVPDGYVAKWKELNSAGIPVVGIRDNPWFDGDPSSCAWQNRHDALKCAREVSEVLLSVDPAGPYEDDLSEFRSVDLTGVFCADGLCPVTFEGRLIWRDSHHVTKTYMHFIAESVEKALVLQAGDLLDETFDIAGEGQK